MQVNVAEDNSILRDVNMYKVFVELLVYSFLIVVNTPTTNS